MKSDKAGKLYIDELRKFYGVEDHLLILPESTNQDKSNRQQDEMLKLIFQSTDISSYAYCNVNFTYLVQ